MFNRFSTTEAFDWFQKKGLSLKVEKDGRVFPSSDSSEDVINCLNEIAINNEFIKFIDDNQRADFFSIQKTNNCILKIFDHYDSSKIIIVSLIDNLLKGAAGQAVQCFNVSNGFAETTALI